MFVNEENGSRSAAALIVSCRANALLTRLRSLVLCLAVCWLFRSLSNWPRRDGWTCLHCTALHCRGGRQYAIDHAAEMNRTSLALETDAGTFTPFRLGFEGRWASIDLLGFLVASCLVSKSRWSATHMLSVRVVCRVMFSQWNSRGARSSLHAWRV